jgi:hypothetical protein
MAKEGLYACLTAQFEHLLQLDTVTDLRSFTAFVDAGR